MQEAGLPASASCVSGLKLLVVQPHLIEGKIADEGEINGEKNPELRNNSSRLVTSAVFGRSRPSQERS